MKKIGILSALVLMLCLLASCAGRQQLVLYTLSADKIDGTASPTEIAKLAQSEGRVAFTGEQFAGVDWSAQRFAVLPAASQSVSAITPESGGCALLKTRGDDIFVWVLNGKPVYMGGFTKGVGSTSTQRTPYITDDERYIFAVCATGDKDPRFDKKLYNYFSKAGLLRSEL